MNHHNIRWMIRRDMAHVLAIDQANFSRSWSEDDYLAELRKSNCIGRVVEVEEEIVAVVIYLLEKRHIQLLRLAVEPWFQRQGIGRSIIEDLTSRLSEFRRLEIRVEVNEHDLTAQQFFRACGLRCDRPGRGEDIYQFRYRLGGKLAEVRPEDRPWVAQCEGVLP